ncbi:MAG: PA14 domain-containing protein [Planctomycetota bacterium]|jgi:mono/diheme cytochrome c family protein
MSIDPRISLPIALAWALGVLLWGGYAHATAPVIPGYERLLKQERVSAVERGEVLLGELNCIGCHQAPPGVASRITSKPGPDLSTITQRVSPRWIADYLKAPHTEKPGATMPDLFHASEAKSRDGAIEFIVHYLTALGGPMQSSTFEAYPQLVDQGRNLYHTVGCVACHVPEGGDAPGSVSVPLPRLAVKYSVRGLSDYLLRPDAYQTGGRMPSLHLTREEADLLAVYLLREQLEIARQASGHKRQPGLAFEYYEGDWRKLPDFTEITPKEVGHVDQVTLDLPIETSSDGFAVRFLGEINLPKRAKYAFSLKSDDGTRLLINDQLVVDNDGIHGPEKVDGKITLGAGSHRFELQYFEGRGGQELSFVLSGKDVTDEELAAVPSLFTRSNTTPIQPLDYQPIRLDIQKAQMGAQMMAVIGCAGCHTTEGAPNQRPARPLVALNHDAPEGCLGDNIRRGNPEYALSDEQHRDLRAALSSLNQLAKPRTASKQIAHSMATYNCYACHERGGIGGPEDARRAHFQVHGEMDLGDEGRIPPTLNGVGSKLQPKALTSVLHETDHHVRGNYMATRMPRFGGALIDELAGAFQVESDIESSYTGVDVSVAPEFSEQAVEAGHRLVGIRGVGCVNCHDVGANKSLGISMVNLASVHERLRPGWFSRFLKNPGSINTGTRMPPFWFNNTVIHQDIAGGTADGQINAIWSYLSLGSSMPVPEGLNVGDKLVLAPVGEPIVFRTFMKDVGPRAIAVGFPESLHVAFDANVTRLAKAWRGRFFDAKGTWDGRAGKFFDPLGEQVIDLPPGPALTILNTDDAPWPRAETADRNLGGRFRGYQLDKDRRPIFMYEINNIDVAEQPLPVIRPGGAIFVRRFHLHSDTDTSGLHMLAAQGAEITDIGDGSWIVDGGTTIRVRSGQKVQPFVRQDGDVKQLLFSVPFENKESSFEVEIAW